MIRIMGSLHYSRTAHFPTADLAARLQALATSTDHEFWPDTLSLRDSSRFNLASAVSTKHLPDLYLLATAITHSGCLVTFDQAIAVRAVAGATMDRVVVL